MFDELPQLPERRNSQAPTAAELKPVVDYLRQVIAEYGAGASGLGLELDREGVLLVLDQLRKAAAGEKWELSEDASVREFFLHGLYFELGERRASLKEKVGGEFKRVPDGIWLQIIDELESPI